MAGDSMSGERGSPFAFIRFVRDLFASTRRDADAQRYDTDQPWICWRFLSTDARTRITGRSVVLMDCCICGQKGKLRICIPRIGDIPEQGKHPERLRFMLDHLHPDRPHVAAWVRPLRNPAAWGKGIDFDLIAMRLQADLNALPTHRVMGTTGPDFGKSLGE